MDKRIFPVKDLDAVDGTIYGKTNKVYMINPYNTYFIVTYTDGSTYKGNNLFETGWDKVHDGIKTLQYKLSTGHLITLPKFLGYLPLIEVSESIEGFKLFHSINIHCLTTDKMYIYTIVLKEDKLRNHRIGDIIVSTTTDKFKSSQWKMSA